MIADNPHSMNTHTLFKRVIIHYPHGKPAWSGLPENSPQSKLSGTARSCNEGPGHCCYLMAVQYLRIYSFAAANTAHAQLMGNKRQASR